MMDRRTFLAGTGAVLLAVPLAAEAQGGYKPEFKMSVVVNEETAWGRAAIRFADAVRHRTAGRIQIKNYFNGQLFADRQTTEFRLLQQGGADFALAGCGNLRVDE
jgi:TRAP-type C4-dicarboxylate transport system substrate-binding protein